MNGRQARNIGEDGDRLAADQGSFDNNVLLPISFGCLGCGSLVLDRDVDIHGFERRTRKAPSSLGLPCDTTDRLGRINLGFHSADGDIWIYQA